MRRLGFNKLSRNKNKIKKAKYILEKAFSVTQKSFNVELWDGSIMKFSPHSGPEFTLVFSNKKVFKEIFFKPNAFTAGEAFVNNDLDIKGDFFQAVRLADDFASIKLPFFDIVKILYNLVTL